MIFLELFNLPNGTTNLDNILVDTATAVPSIIPLLLFFVFFIVFLGGIGKQKLATGDADYSMWAIIGSISMYVIALIMTMIEGLIRLDWLIVVTVITIFSGVWFFMSRGKGVI